ncbi:hypothetical protein HS041_28450 [Planomonospora sp. ID67723]|uniref:hypothetical protein n=1 Tax=Planomonospora sp. ID67723 TaxID=2738134 RepID=UPI0018C3A329|nr:hypothetical protein [Planomonospora sp. ID67723]MBG0831665.1 hypothetical protein [Planomonospora sp. ID67723]
MPASTLLPVPPLVLYGRRPVFLRGREPLEGQLWAHLCWIIPADPVTDAPSIIERCLPYADVAELDGQPYDQLPHRPGALLMLPPLVAYAGQVVLLRGWRHARGSWWAQLARLTVGERDDKRRAVLTDLHVAAAEVTPLPGQNYAHVPRTHHSHQ